MFPSAGGDDAVPARIVVIEDDEEDIELIDFLLSGRGHVPLFATNWADGIRIALLVQPALILLDPDLILFDVRMPVIDGCQVAAAIRNQPGLDRTRIVEVTADVSGDERERIAAAGFDGYIRKPIDLAAFAEQVEHFLPECPPAQDATADRP